MQWDHVKVPPLSSVQLGRGESCLKWKHHKRLMAETASFMGSMQGCGITSRQVMKSGLWHLNKTLLSIREIAESGMLEIRPGSNRTCSKKQNQKTSHQGSSSCWTRCKEPLILNILLVIHMAWWHYSINCTCYQFSTYLSTTLHQALWETGLQGC